MHIYIYICNYYIILNWPLSHYITFFFFNLLQFWTVFVQLLSPTHGKGVCITHWSYEPCQSGLPKTDWPQWRVLTKRDPREEATANHPSTLAVKTPWTVNFDLQSTFSDKSIVILVLFCFPHAQNIFFHLSLLACVCPWS